MLKKFPSEKKLQKKHSFFFHEFQLIKVLLLLKQNVHLSKTVCGIFHFQFRVVFIKVYIFVQQKAWTL